MGLETMCAATPALLVSKCTLIPQYLLWHQKFFFGASLISSEYFLPAWRESQAHEIISGLAQKFDLLGRGYFTQKDVQHELEREMSAREFGELKKDLHDYHDFAGTAQACLSEILSNSI